MQTLSRRERNNIAARAYRDRKRTRQCATSNRLVCATDNNRKLRMINESLVRQLNVLLGKEENDLTEYLSNNLMNIHLI